MGEAMVQQFFRQIMPSLPVLLFFCGQHKRLLRHPLLFQDLHVRHLPELDAHISK
jgi:hypothetical protein